MGSPLEKENQLTLTQLIVEHTGHYKLKSVIIFFLQQLLAADCLPLSKNP